MARLLAGAGAFSALGLAGDLLSAVLLDRNPALVVVLSPRSAYIAAAAGAVPAAVVLPLAVARLCAADPLHFGLGRRLGQAGPARTRLAGLVARLGRRLPRPLGLVAVALSPTAKVLVVAGAARLPAGAVAVADVGGTAARVLAVWSAGRAFPALAERAQGAVAVVVGATAVVSIVTAVVSAIGRAARRKGVDRMRVMVTNDDGIEAPGLAAVARALVGAGHEVSVVAPVSDHSGFGAALGPVHRTGTVAYGRRRLPGLDGVDAVWVDGPPALAALCGVLGGCGARADVVVSGVNAGANTGGAVLHSGTVGAALTAARYGLPAAAISLAPGSPWYWDTAAALCPDLLGACRAAPAGTVLNVNVPNVPGHGLRGLRWARLAPGGTVEAVAAGPAEGVLELSFGSEPDIDDDTDERLLAAGWVTVTVLGGPHAVAGPASGANGFGSASPGVRRPVTGALPRLGTVACGYDPTSRRTPWLPT